MNLVELSRLRLANQRLIDSEFNSPVDVVTALGAIQAQDYPGAKWAVGLRAPNTTDGAIEAALNEGSIIRTHVLRPTWHLVRPTDLRWMLDLTAKRIKGAMAFGNRWLGFDQATFRRAAKALERSLEGRALTRAELAAVFERARVDVKGDQRLGHLLMNAELDCLICSGPRQGKHATYALFDERISAAPPIERDEALLRLTNIYFTTRGPATAHDFAWWSGLTVEDARHGIEMAARDLERVTVGDRSYWMSAQSVAPKKRPVAHLLPNYDEFFIAYRDRSALAERLRKSGFTQRTDNLFTHIAISDGQLIGTWRRTKSKRGVSVQLDTLTDITKSERARFAAQAKRFEEFFS
jgi:hypothetical protein